MQGIFVKGGRGLFEKRPGEKLYTGKIYWDQRLTVRLAGHSGKVEFSNASDEVETVFRGLRALKTLKWRNRVI